MDKQLLEALSNIGNALDMLVEALDKKQEAKSATATAMQGGDFGKQLETISAQVKSIKADTQQIIKNQQTIIGLSKQKESDKKTGEVEGASDPKKESAIKKGVGTILLIAVAVLAIGLAFKLVGKIDFLSVVGLALAITIIAIAFEKVASLNLGLKEAAIASLTIVMISAALTISSWLLSMITPISFVQALTGIMIGVMFGAVAIGLGKMLEAFAKIGVTNLVKSVIFLPLILPAIALGIALASYALQLVKPIGLSQFFGAVMVGLVFVVLAFGLKKIISAFQGIDPATAVVASFMIPILFTAMSIAIWASSNVLSLVVPISFMQFLVSIAISVVFLILSYVMAPILLSISQMKWGDVPKIPVFFTLVSLAIMLSSHILAMTADIGIGQLLKIALFGLTLALLIFAMTIPIRILANVPIKELLLGTLGAVVVSLAIMVSSHILAMGNYNNYPDWNWALGVGLSLLAFTPAIVALGLIALTGVGAVAFLVGIPMVLAVAETIVGVSHILSDGNYDNKGMLQWAIATTLLYAAFTPILLILGAVGLANSVISFFGPDPWAMAKDMMFQIAETIVGVSFILQKGVYKDGPTKEWAEGIAISLGAFSPVYAMLMKNQIFSLFGGGGVGPTEFTEAILTVSDGIITAAEKFANAKTAFKGGPPKAWAEGVGLAIGAFAPVYEVLAANSGWLSSGVSVDDMKNAILTISQGIVDSAEFFAKNKSPFEEGNYPTEKWGKGVGAALNAFAPVFKALSEDTGWFTSGEDVIKSMIYGVKSISRAIVSVGKIFATSKIKWDVYPTDTWSNGVKKAVHKFISLSKYIDDQNASYWQVTNVASKLTEMAKILYGAKDAFSMTIDPNYIKNVGQNMLDFNELVAKLVEAEGNKSLLDKLGSATDSMLGSDPISQIARRMVTLAEGYDKLASSLIKLGTAMKTLNISDVRQLGGLTREISGVNISRSENDNIMSPKKSMQMVAQTGGLSTQTKISPEKATMLKKMDRMIDLLKNIDRSSSSLNDFMQGNEDTSVKSTNIK